MATAGYSGTPLPTKLGIRAEARVLLVRAPGDLALEPLPAGVVVQSRAGREPYDVALLFVRARAELARRFGQVAGRLTPAGGLWVCWPKRASGLATDLDEGVVRTFGLAAGLVDNKVCAIDATWSGLRFVVRLADRRPPGQVRGTAQRAVERLREAP